MKTVVIGDIHGRSVWKLIVHLEKPDRVIFIGDYFNTRESFTPLEQMRNFEDIIQFKKESGIEVRMLIGNHDHHYFPEVGDTGTSGYQSGSAVAISFLLNESRDLLQMAYDFDNFLFTHAGVSPIWLSDNGYEGPMTPFGISSFVNELWKHKPLRFLFCGMDPYGQDVFQTPIWIRPRSLMNSWKETPNLFIQVVGHTGMKSIDIKGKSTSGRYYFIDTLGTSGEHLIIEDGEISTGSTR